MITPAYAPTATERVLPRLALDFTTAVTDARVITTRALNTATRVNSNGYIEIINANLPRYDFDPVTKLCLGQLIEESRQNLLLQSATISDAAWYKTQAKVDPTTVLSPDGTTYTEKLVELATSASHIVGQLAVASAASGVTYTATFFLKAAERGFAFVGMLGAGFTVAPFISVNLSTGAVSTANGSPTASSARNFGNGWWRVSISATTNAVGAVNAETRISTDGNWANRNYTGDGTSGIYVWGGQVEAGAFATSYIPTTTTSLTRNADQVAMTGTNFSSWFTAGPGTLYSEASQPVIFAASRSSASLCGSANNPRLSCYRQAAGTLNGYAINSAGTGNGVSGGASATANTVHKTVLSYSATNAQRVCANGNAGNPMTVDMTTSFGGINSLAIGSDFVGNTSGYCGHIRKIMWWPQQLTTAEAQTFSK